MRAYSRAGRIVIGASALYFALLTPRATAQQPAPAPTPVLMGTYSVTSTYNKYLQAKSGEQGELHASRDSQGKEETWNLFKAEGNGKTLYYLQNAESQRYLRTRGTDCPLADILVPGTADQYFELVYPKPDYPAAGIRFLKDSRYLMSRNPGTDVACNGEVETTTNAPTIENPEGEYWHLNKN
jgi:hypothetical protein